MEEGERGRGREKGAIRGVLCVVSFGVMSAKREEDRRELLRANEEKERGRIEAELTRQFRVVVESRKSNASSFLLSFPSGTETRQIYSARSAR